MDENALRRLADLAKLRLTEDEEHALRAQMDRVLEAFRVLEEVDTSGVEASPYPLAIPHRTRAAVALFDIAPVRSDVTRKKAETSATGPPHGPT